MKSIFLTTQFKTCNKTANIHKGRLKNVYVQSREYENSGSSKVHNKQQTVKGFYTRSFNKLKTKQTYVRI